MGCVEHDELKLQPYEDIFLQKELDRRFDKMVENMADCNFPDKYGNYYLSGLFLKSHQLDEPWSSYCAKLDLLMYIGPYRTI